MPVQLTIKKVKGIPLVDHLTYQAMDEAFNETYVKQYCRGAYCVGIGPMGAAEIAELHISVILDRVHRITCVVMCRLTVLTLL